MTIQETVLDYLDKFPLIERHNKQTYVSQEWIDKEIIFGVNDLPDAMGGVVRKDVTGNTTKGHTFMFSAFFTYTDDTLRMLENSTFFEELMYWVEKNNKQGVLPKFDNGRKALEVELVQTPYLFMVDPSNSFAQYSLTFRLIYQERKI